MHRPAGPAEAPADNPLPFVGGLIGYLGYDFGRRLEQLPAQAVDDLLGPVEVLLLPFQVPVGRARDDVAPACEPGAGGADIAAA